MGLPASRLAPCGAIAEQPDRCGAALILLGLAGWSGSGKTTLIAAVLPLLRAAGLRVSTIKHAHHGMELDKPGKDSFIHRQAGAEEVMLVGGARWALLHETPEGPADVAQVASRLAPVDLVLVEGFKNYPFEKIEIYRPALGKPPFWPDLQGVVAVATDAACLPDCAYPVLDLNDPGAVAHFMVTFTVQAPWRGGRL